MTAKSDKSASVSASGNAAVHPEITVLTGGRELRLEVGAKVQILQHKHLRCSPTGYVQRINGGYNYVHPDDRAIIAVNPAYAAFELYPNEIKVVANYRHKDFQPGVAVRIKNLDWRKARAKSHGVVRGVSATRIIVQPIGSRSESLISVVPEDLQVERNQAGLSNEALLSQVAILGVLRSLDGPVTFATLKSLLQRLPGVSEVDARLACLANAGKIKLTDGHATYVRPQGESVPAAHTELHAAIAALEAAERRLNAAVHQAVLQG